MQSASSVRSHRARVCAAVALLQLAASSAAEARSPDSAVQSSPSSTDGASGGDRNAEGALGPVRIGAFGGVGFPRPLSVEAMVKIDDLVGLGVEYGALPQVTVSSVTAAMNAVAVDVRVFPMRNGFFVGLAAGRQEIDATATVAVSPALGSLSGQVSAETWYLNPRIGFLWTWRSGITIGMDVGAQIPVASNVTNTIPTALAASQTATNVVNSFSSNVLPTIDLLRVGFLF